MKIIKPGVNFSQHSSNGLTVCPRCGCAFRLSIEDVENDSTINLVDGAQMYECPNSSCKHRMVLRYFQPKDIKLILSKQSSRKKHREVTPDNIEELKKGEIFVFGSNMLGEHAGGAARIALEKFGAINRRAEGIQGQSYAIPTLDKELKKLPLEDIAYYIQSFLQYAYFNPNKKFYVTKIGCGIAGFEVAEIRHLFRELMDGDNLPNVILPKEFM